MLQALVVRFSFCFFLCSAILLIGSAAFAQRPKVLAPHVPVAPKMARRHPLAPSTLQSAVGGTKCEKFTSQPAVQNYLPDGGTPTPLKRSFTDPLRTMSGAGTLGSQALALRLNIDFSNIGVFPGGLSNLVYTGAGPLNGMTVAQIMVVTNIALGGGGLPAGVSYGDLASVLGNINGNFDGGIENNGYLK